MKKRETITVPADVVTMIAKEEGFRKNVYKCVAGYPTIGYGWKIAPVYVPIEHFKYLTVSRTLARQQLKEHIRETYRFLDESKHLPAIVFKKLNAARQAVIISMAYQMGNHALHTFTKTFNALERDDYVTAAAEMLDSRWARQTPERAGRHAEQMQSGEWHPYYS